ncbi:hypothetical protein [Lacrimispora sp. HJ-01]
MVTTRTLESGTFMKTIQTLLGHAVTILPSHIIDLSNNVAWP